MAGTAGTAAAAQLRAQSAAHGAHNYDPLPVMISAAEGAWVADLDGRRYLDMLAASRPSTSVTGIPGWSPRHSASSSGSRW
jgi:4-aminobutyrate aminotransferase-like enzyme